MPIDSSLFGDALFYHLWCSVEICDYLFSFLLTIDSFAFSVCNHVLVSNSFERLNLAAPDSAPQFILRDVGKINYNAEM